MKPPRSLGLSVFAGLAALLLASCGHTIIDKPTKLRGDDWVLTIRRVTDGPNAYNEQNTAYKPAKGQRFISVYITLHNLQHVARKFNFDRCDLDGGDQVYVPTLIDADDFGPILVPANLRSARTRPSNVA